jgi:putative transposase
MLDRWAYLNGVGLDFSRPGKPVDNAHIEAFNARFRQGCLNASWFLSLADARDWSPPSKWWSPPGKLGRSE